VGLADLKANLKYARGINEQSGVAGAGPLICFHFILAFKLARPTNTGCFEYAYKSDPVHIWCQSIVQIYYLHHNLI